MIHGAHRSAADLCTLEPGTHLCALEPGEIQLDRVAATFVGQGLAAGDRLLYVASDEQAEALVTALPEHVHVAEALATGQLRISSFADAYGTRRPDDLSAVADGFRAAAAQACKDGFPGLRVAARMDGLSALLGSHQEVLAWERMSTYLQHELEVSSVCLYDASRLDPEQAASIAREHDGQAPEVDVPPIGTFLAVDEPWGLRVSGEVDVSNRDLLKQLVLSRAAVTPRLRLDLGEVTFADIGTMCRLQAAAAELPDSGWLLLDRVPHAVRRILEVAGISHERLRVAP
ncbi:anti-anti-sigma regulatory factor [Nocardioides sp. BE266]|uniref:MEDS domain-containing protein n=1 Tax=Nocardioides sp. BE266 TaxID=2817725 RepID=UPI00285B9C0D|nr:MEDS domain-containing protein [Nocardioides sp. BE266]MDR7254693.1 anti-anti-sigma regulatory factor [Nocardioides sp. BE266]